MTQIMIWVAVSLDSDEWYLNKTKKYLLCEAKLRIKDDFLIHCLLKQAVDLSIV